MYKITNIDSLGTTYTVQDQATRRTIKNIQVIPHTEILEAALGPLTADFDSIQSYLDKSISVLEGFEEVDLYTTLWYSSTDGEVILQELFEYAIQHGYDRIILESLEPTID